MYPQRQVETETFATLDLWIPQAVSGTGSTLVLLVLDRTLTSELGNAAMDYSKDEVITCGVLR